MTTTLKAAMCAVLVAGCNLVTGAEGLTLGDSWVDEETADGNGSSGAGADSNGNGSGADGSGADGAGADGSGAGSGAGGPGAGGAGNGGGDGGDGGVGAGGGGGNGGSGNGGSGGAPPPPPPPVGDAADGVSITDLELYQGVRVPIMNATSDIPIVAGRDAMVRVFYQTDGNYDGQPVTARFSSGAYYAEASGTLGNASSQGTLSSTLNIDVPGHMITVGGTFRIDLVQPTGSGTNSAAGYPQGTQEIPLEAESSGDTLNVVLVPVEYNGSLPDTSQAQVDKYAQYLAWQYPIPNVVVTVRAQSISFNGYLGNYNGWSQLLDDVTQLRSNDNVANDVYYYGIHNANGNGLLGLGWVGSAGDSWSRAAIGVGWTGDTAPETAVHEIGHNHGRNHAPCGVSGDNNYPHAGASIGVLAYHPGTDSLLSPNDYVDFMSYCNPAWISDYTYKALFNRLQYVNSAAPSIAPGLMNRTYERVRILEGQAEWLEPIEMTTPPVGEALQLTVTSVDSHGPMIGHFYRYDHLDGGVIYVRQPDVLTPTNVYQALEISVADETFSLMRP